MDSAAPTMERMKSINSNPLVCADMEVGELYNRLMGVRTVPRLHRKTPPPIATFGEFVATNRPAGMIASPYPALNTDDTNPLDDSVNEYSDDIGNIATDMATLSNAESIATLKVRRRSIHASFVMVRTVVISSSCRYCVMSSCSFDIDDFSTGSNNDVVFSLFTALLLFIFDVVDSMLSFGVNLNLVI